MGSRRAVSLRLECWAMALRVTEVPQSPLSAESHLGGEREKERESERKSRKTLQINVTQGSVLKSS